jgi:hypothetical protein
MFTDPSDRTERRPTRAVVSAVCSSSTAAAGWSEVEDEILGEDLTAALADTTPAGVAVVTPVNPIGLHDGTGTWRTPAQPGA